jgi:hypothetical protein
MPDELIQGAETDTRKLPLAAQWAVIAYFLVVTALVPLAQVWVEAARGEPFQVLDVLHRSPTTASLTAYERAMEKQSVIATQVRQHLQWLGLVALRMGNRKALVGPQGALFYRPSLEAVLRPGFMVPPWPEGHPVAAITAFQQSLARQGVRLVVLPVPGKEAIYPEWLDPAYDPVAGPAVNPDMAAFRHETQARGVEVLDPTALLWSHKTWGELYLRHDTHWSPLGLRLVADELARHLPEAAAPGRPFTLQDQAITAPGDLYDMLQLPPLPTPLKPQQVVVERVVDAHTGAPTETAPASPVVLLGDSFTNIYSVADMGWGQSAGLGEQLAYRLGRPLDVIAMNDGGVNRARVTLARRPNPLTGKQVVVWQFAARDLVVSNGDWKTITIGRQEKE